MNQIVRPFWVRRVLRSLRLREGCHVMFLVVRLVGWGCQIGVGLGNGAALGKRGGGKLTWP